MDNRLLDLFGLAKGFNFSITEGLLWNIYTLFFFFYVFMTLIFVYHWHRYEGNGSLVFVGEVIYLVG